MLKQGLHQRMLQKLSPQQIQLMKLLQVPTASLEQRIKEELEANPALEEGKEEEEDEYNLDDRNEKSEETEEQPEDDFDIDDYINDDDIPYYKTSANNSSADDEKYEAPLTSGKSFHEQLVAQLGILELDERQHLIGLQLIGSLDDDGYLRRDVESIVDDMAFSQNITTTGEEVLGLLRTIQTFDPAGVGARDLRECLLLQLQRREDEDRLTRYAIRIVDEYISEFSKKHYSKIAGALGLDDETLKDAIHEILKLNPRPGSTFATDARTSEAIIPDFILNNNDGKLELTLNARNAPELRLSRTYSDMLEGYAKEKKKSNREAFQFVKQKLDAAKWFIDAIKQRQATLLRTMQAILEYQQEYFLEEDEKALKPMILKDIAEIVGMDISTVSRVANSKYVQTPFGTFLLKTFFSESMTTESGEEVSSREVKKILSEAVGSEDKRKPLPDDQLAQLLKEKGYNIARRTVAKYREQLHIPVARLRKEL